MSLPNDTAASSEETTSKDDQRGDMAAKPNEEWWTTDDVATYAGLAPGTIRAYVSRKQMPAPERLGRIPVWRPDVIKAWRAGHVDIEPQSDEQQEA